MLNHFFAKILHFILAKFWDFDVLSQIRPRRMVQLLHYDEQSKNDTVREISKMSSERTEFRIDYCSNPNGSNMRKKNLFMLYPRPRPGLANAISGYSRVYLFLGEKLRSVFEYTFSPRNFPAFDHVVRHFFFIFTTIYSGGKFFFYAGYVHVLGPRTLRSALSPTDVLFALGWKRISRWHMGAGGHADGLYMRGNKHRLYLPIWICFSFELPQGKRRRPYIITVGKLQSFSIIRKIDTFFARFVYESSIWPGERVGTGGRNAYI